jgi:hypothetical protein
MMFSSLSPSGIRSTAEKKFVTDKKGKTYFFPWGPKRTGYIVPGRERRETFLRLYARIYLFFLIVIAANLLYSFFTKSIFFVIVLPAALFVIWLLAQQLHTWLFIRSLPRTKKKYADLAPVKVVQGEGIADDKK